MNDSIACLWLTLQGKNALLPSAAIAEIFPFVKPVAVADVPNWLLGILAWRGIQVPLVQLEKMESHLLWDPVDSTSEEKPFYEIAIINRIVKTGGIEKHLHPYPFFAIALKSAPKLYHVRSENIQLLEQGGDKDPRFIAQVKLNNDVVFIPDLPYLWSILDALPPRLQWFRQIVL